MGPLELLDLPIRTPTEVPVSRFLQIHAGELIEAASRAEPRGRFVGNRLVVDEPVRASRLDRSLIEAHRIDVPAFDSCDFRADERRSVFEILRAVFRPDF